MIAPENELPWFAMASEVAKERGNPMPTTTQARWVMRCFVEFALARDVVRLREVGDQAGSQSARIRGQGPNATMARLAYAGAMDRDSSGQLARDIFDAGGRPPEMQDGEDPSERDVGLAHRKAGIESTWASRAEV